MTYAIKVATSAPRHSYGAMAPLTALRDRDGNINQAGAAFLDGKPVQKYARIGLYRQGTGMIPGTVMTYGSGSGSGSWWLQADSGEAIPLQVNGKMWASWIVEGGLS